ncbi:MAG: DUF2270 domain-containing protein [Longimicrobiales bacterium]
MAARLPEQTLVHFYRAVVAHMDVWRQRMDATTNWAAATAAGMITFAFGTPASPHFVLLLALAFQAVFLIMESRRYQMYDLWRRRFRTLNHYLVAPALLASDPADAGATHLAQVASDLGRTVPHLRLLDAIGYRIRRNYIYLFLVTLAAWLLRLETHPYTATSFAELVGRANIGGAPGMLVLGFGGAFALTALLLALRAPSEQMLNWTEVPAPLARWTRLPWRSKPGDPPAGGSDAATS